MQTVLSVGDLYDILEVANVDGHNTRVLTKKSAKE